MAHKPFRDGHNVTVDDDDCYLIKAMRFSVNFSPKITLCKLVVIIRCQHLTYHTSNLSCYIGKTKRDIQSS